MTTFRHVLITGGAGFIGANYVHHALQHHPDWQVTVLDKLTYAANLHNLDEVRDRITFVKGDIANQPDVERCLPGVDAIVNFAAESHVDRSLLDATPFLRTNIEGTVSLLEAARRHGGVRLLQVSTDEVYGDLSGSAHHSLETDPLRPRSPYAASKAAAEHLLQAYHASHGIDAVVTRGSNTYGPYQYPEKIIPYFLTNALEDKPLPLYGNGSAVRDYLHVEDHCAGIDLLLHRGVAGETYNLGARLEVSGLEVARRLLALLHKPESLITFVADRPGHDYRYSVDPAKAETLGWRTSWGFDRGLERTVAWYLDHPEWWRAVRQGQPFQQLQSDWYRGRTT